MRKNKGFTLVELLVVVVILGIITAISIPLIRNIQDRMEQKKYTTYLDSLKTSAKLYNDSYNEDIFGRNKTGVYCLSYEELENKKLIKDISIEDVSCKRPNTLVRITKLEDKYVYVPFLTCGSKSNSSDEKIKLPKGHTASINEEFCNKKINTTILINADTTYVGNSYNKKRKKTKLTISSLTGIQNNINISYAWSKDENAYESSSYTRIGFKVEGNQKEKLLNGEVIETRSDELITPKGENGIYYLLVKVEKLNDIYGNNWKNPDGTDSKYIKFGPFAVDNEKPKIENLKVVSTNKNYNAIDTKVEFTGTDNLTSQNNLRMCIKEGSYCTNYKKYAQSTDNSNGGSACSETTKSITHNPGDNTKWGTLCAPTKKGYTFSGWKSGNTQITKDTVVNKNIDVKASWTANKYTVTFNGNGGSVSPGSKQVTYDSTYGTLPTPTRTGYIFIGWYTSGNFDANYYSNKYKDLKTAFGTDYQKLINHWVKYGMNEERNSSSNYRKAKDIYKVEGNQTLIAGWIRYGEDSSCGCHEYNSCEACGCANYRLCKSSACGTITTTTKVYATIWVLQSYCSSQTIANGYTWHAVRPGSNAMINCTSAIGNKTNQGCCRYYRYQNTTTTNECRDSSCGCETYNSCSSCSCKTYNTCYY